MDNLNWNFEVWQNGQKVAYGNAPSYEEAAREAFHYGRMYVQDGPAVKVKITERRRKPARASGVKVKEVGDV